MVTRASQPSPRRVPPLWGLVLAGGTGSRIGRDKGELDYHGVPQARWAFDLLAGFCERCYVSVRPEQARIGVYATLPLIPDQLSGGPAAGLLTAWGLAPGVAWLLLATDMPLIDETVLETLVRGRAPGATATAFRRPDGMLEPLCAIWEPGAAQAMLSRTPASVSLRAVLETSTVAVLAMADASRFRSVNTARDDLDLRARIAAGS